MRRGFAIAITICNAAALALVWRCRSDQSPSPSAPRSKSKTERTKRVVPIARGSIMGMVIDEAKAPIPGAFVCLEARSDDLDPELLRHLPCVTSDARGAFTNEPVEGARVVTEGSEGDSKMVVMTDERGAFRASRLPAGRYAVSARTEHGGVVVQLHPAALVVGKVIVSTTKQVCEDPSVSLRDASKDRHLKLSRRDNGTIVGEGVLPGTYAVDVSCKGFLAREVYAPVIVGSSDVAVAWEVDPGATIRGTIRTASGAPVRTTYVSAIRQRTGDDKWRANHDVTDEHGDYEIAGLLAGTFTLTVRSIDIYAADAQASLTVAEGTTIKRDLVIPDAGVLRGRVVDNGGTRRRRAQDGRRHRARLACHDHGPRDRSRDAQADGEGEHGGATPRRYDTLLAALRRERSQPHHRRPRSLHDQARAGR